MSDNGVWVCFFIFAFALMTCNEQPKVIVNVCEESERDEGAPSANKSANAFRKFITVPGGLAPTTTR